MKRKLGDKINRGFVGIAVVLGTVMAIRFAIAFIIEFIIPQIEYLKTR